MSRIVAIVLAAFVAVGPVAASAQEARFIPAQSGGTVDIEVCNRTGLTVLIAAIFSQSGSWRSEGWFRLNNGQCGVVGYTDNSIFYLYAEDAGGSGRYWGSGALQHCVTRPGPYAEYVAESGMTCRADQELVEFSELQAQGTGTFTWNLDY